MSNADENLFDFNMEEEGGIFDATGASPGLVSILEDHKNRAQQWLLHFSNKSFGTFPQMPKLIFGFLDDPSFNAIAKIFDNYGYIGVRVGTVVILYDLFMRLLTYSNIFRDIGDPSLETMTVPSLQAGAIDANDLISSGGPYGLPLQMAEPKDVIRRYYAAHLTQLAFDFLLLHEIGHIIHGHLEFLVSKETSTSISELNVNKTNIESITHQAIEMDADTFAILQSLHVIKMRIDGKIEVPNELSYIYKSFQTAIVCWIRSINLVIQLFKKARNQGEDTFDSIYPHPRVRQIMILENAAIVIGILWDGEHQKSFREFCTYEIIENEYSYGRITGNLFSDDEIRRFAKNPKISEQATKLIAEWRRIKPSLQPFTHDVLPE